MENTQDNINFIPILTVFLSGLFGLLVAYITWNLASKREKEKFKQELAFREFKEKEELYISILSSLDKTVKFTKTGKDYSELFNDLTFISAKSKLLATESINIKFSEISDILYVWSSRYRQSLPKKVGGTDYGIVTNLDNEHREKADEIYPELIKSINDLVSIIKKELNYLKNELKK
ncbi:hypothetical protein [Maribacter hydrothermalis]|uniref:Uncharacterized protein n=1 Tax=Maribacter hydrothermalis TaxID=1836467 RepID=A0A1B7Z5N8_9FLAO|nr:hypothetical protein [Maribacter hydrothermalis]APQ18802.1 hypothetical protein BTR34_16420 [Maribacter hydrothermalis]OBR38031.1 hypothetical protein A9200_18280 [Maribacter hydrothermalis]